MTDTRQDANEQSDRSGWVKMTTRTGKLMNVFVFSNQDIKDLSPTDETYEKVAVMMGEEHHE